MTDPGSLDEKSIGFFALFNEPPKVTDAYYERTLMGIVYGLYPLGRELVLRCEEGRCEEGASVVKPLLNPGWAGILLMCPHLDEGKADFLKKIGVPLVLIFTKPRDKAFASIAMDNRRGARAVMEHLLSLGHKRVAFVGGNIETSLHARERYEGYREGLTTAGLPLNPALVHHGKFYVRHGYDAMRKLLELPAGERPTALFGANDMIALGAMQAAGEAGLRIPDDLSVVGFDDIETAQTADPPLTTVRQPFYEMGLRAARLLESLMADPATTERQILVEPSLRIRESTAPPPQG